MAVSTRRHARLKRSIAEYAIDYATGERTIKSWIRRGKLSGDQAPLDVPEKMAGWFERAFGRKIPDRLLSFQSAGAQMSTSPPTETHDFTSLEVPDIEQSVQNLRRTLAKNQVFLDESFTPANQRTYRDCFDLLRKTELDLIAVQQKRGQLINRQQVEMELAQAAQTFATTRDRMARDIMIEVEKHCPKRLVRVFGLIQNLLEPAIRKVREGEDELLRDLGAITSPDSVGPRLDLILQRE